MANRSRPQKTRVPYRKYVAGEGFSKVGFTRQDRAHNKEDVVAVDNAANDQQELPRSSLNPNSMMTLPWELQKLIIKYSERPALNYLLVCSRWYWLTVPLIYRSPKLTSKNFSNFVTAVIADRKKKMGSYVCELDLSTIMQSGKNSYVSKLLRRCSPHLEKFTAPQTSFGYAPLISLKACCELKYLDLGLVSETVKLKELFQAIKNFTKLTHLSFPRSSIDCKGCEGFVWPSNLQYLKLSGGITNEFIRDTTWPATIKTLEFSYCPQIDENSLYVLLMRIGNNLRHLYFHYPMPSLRDNSLDYVFRYCTNLISIQLTVDYVTKWAFSEYMLVEIEGFERPLKTIYLVSSGALGMSAKIHPDDFTIAIMEQRLPHLQNLSVSSKLGWDMKSSDVEDLVTAIDDQDGGLYLSH